MYCPNCGRKIEDGGLFCPDCGASLATQPTSMPGEQTANEAYFEQSDSPVVVMSDIGPYEYGFEQPGGQAYPDEMLEPAAMTGYYPPAAYEAQALAEPAGSAAPAPPPPPAAAPPPAGSAPPPFAAAAPPPPASAPQPAVGQPQTPPPVTQVTQPPQQMQLPQPQPTKKKSKAPLIISIILGVVLLVVGGFGVYAYMRSSQYNTAIETFEAADDGFNRANTPAAYQAAKELYQTAKDSFDDLGDYKEAVTYSSRCSSQITLCQKHSDYLDAVALYEAEDYAAALSAFNALSGFLDSDSLSDVCQNHLDYQAAIELYENGDLDDALDAFKALRDISFLDSGEWYNKTRYAQAESLLQAGDRYGAYTIFTSLGSYSDSSDRALGCTTPYPASGELWHNDGYYSSAVQMNFNGDGMSRPCFIKVYSGDTLVSTVFVHPNTNVRINLPAGTYTFKEAVGVHWFGDQIMFGDDGIYMVMTFDGGSTSTYLEYNYIYTLSLHVTEGGNVGSDFSNRNDF